MDVYKIKPLEIPYKKISKEQFEEDTHRQPPWYQINRDEKEIHYAVCPACDNPIQIIGLYNLPKNLKRPYGKHLTHGIPRLADHNSEAKENCPYFKPRQHQKKDRKKRIQGIPLQILHLLVTQFDRVIFLLNQCTGLTFSKNYIKKMLGSYRAEEGYLYTGATLMNIPWIFAYMSDSQSLFKQKISNNPMLTDAILHSIPHADIKNGHITNRIYPNGKTFFFSLNICFIHHRQKKSNEYESLTETMKMIVSTEKAGQTVDIYKQDIIFDHEYFQNLIHLPNETQSRRADLLDLAKQVLGDLGS